MVACPCPQVSQRRYCRQCRINSSSDRTTTTPGVDCVLPSSPWAGWWSIPVDEASRWLLGLDIFVDTFPETSSLPNGGPWTNDRVRFYPLQVVEAGSTREASSSRLELPWMCVKNILPRAHAFECSWRERNHTWRDGVNEVLPPYYFTSHSLALSCHHPFAATRHTHSLSLSSEIIGDGLTGEQELVAQAVSRFYSSRENSNAMM